MILQALTQRYEDLLKLGKISGSGWGPAKISYGLEIAEDGQVIGLISLKAERQMGKKITAAPRTMEVPMPVSRSVNIKANFLFDHSGYLLGIDENGVDGRTAECFTASKQLHLSLLSGLDSPAAKAVAAYFQYWRPESASGHPALAEDWDELMSGANLIFWFRGDPVTADPLIRQAWQAHYDAPGDGPVMPCLITGKSGPIALTHPAIKGVRGAQSSGAALVSFNAPAFCSYGREQNANAPVSEYAAFAYTSALNHLLADAKHSRVIGDTTVVCWAEGGEDAYGEAGLAALYGDDERLTESDLKGVLDGLAKGESVGWQGIILEPGRRFYVLGLAPNAARLSVRFFLEDNFGQFIERINAHYQRLEITRPSYDNFKILPLWKLLSETVNQKSKDKSPSSLMTGALLRSILSGGRYPAALLNETMLRIRAERNITRGRAAILKAYYLRNEHQKCPKEVLKVELNEASANIPYALGRLFSLLESVQQAANPGVNATIKDKYFNSAASTPAVIFPLLINLAQKHFRKLSDGQRIFYEKQIGALTLLIGENYPRRMTLPEQGAFHLGYYFQTQKRYEKKEGK